MSHVVLLGDSIFDNARYVPDGPPVIQQLQDKLPTGWQATLGAVDGAVAADVLRQMARMPREATHLVLSVGGNDALANSGIVYTSDLTSEEGFEKLAAVQAEFRDDYRDACRALAAAKRPTILCTVYDSVPGLEPAAVAGLAAFNDVILREAISFGWPVLDLRFVCAHPRDYSTVSPIEPSEIGGGKIAAALARLVVEHDFQSTNAVVYRG
ncbi:MAG: SGNH/GDSL hydrolase family protein [Planctomycetia bacterium]